MKGRISLMRVHGLDEPFVRLEVDDDLSRTKAVEVNMSLEQFGRLMSGLSSVPCEFALPSKVVGLKHEHKQELVPVPGFSCHGCTSDEISKLLEPFEIDGWQAYSPDMENNHRSERVDGKYFQRVTFHRYVMGD